MARTRRRQYSLTERMLRRGIKRADTWIALGSAAVALTALGFSIAENRAGERHDRLSVRPALLLAAIPGADTVVILVENNGLGPAEIKSFQIFVDRQPVRSWREMLRQIGVPPDSVELGGFEMEVGDFVPHRTGHAVLFKTHDPNDVPAIRRGLRRIDAEVCYCSMYGDCWRTSLRAKNRAVAACEE